ncbi:MAG: branched-chain amino acid ABC transporter permease [Actinobacteria bacterium]|nr:branched-chain amino acid ABC transporter permease [Actinomycetota bacterium]
MDIGAVFENAILQFIGFNACYYAIAAIGLNVQFGYTGLLNFGQAAFMAAGAYGVGQTVSIFGISLWWGVAIGIGYAVFLGLLMGVPTLRLRADYLAIVTIASAEIVRLIVRSVKFRDQFGGTDGLKGFADAYQDVGVRIGLEPAGEYGFWIFTFSGRNLWNLMVGWSLVAIFGVIVWRLMKSPWGRVLKAIREDEDAVRSLGKNVYSYKMQSLVLGGVIGSFAGMMLALGNANVQPDNFSRNLTFFVLTGLVLGGVAKVTGSIIGPMMFWGLYAFLDSLLRELIDKPVRIGDFTLMQSTDVGVVVYMLMGILLVVLMVYRPQGVFGNKKEMAFEGR